MEMVLKQYQARCIQSAAVYCMKQYILRVQRKETHYIRCCTNVIPGGCRDARVRLFQVRAAPWPMPRYILPYVLHQYVTAGPVAHKESSG